MKAKPGECYENAGHEFLFGEFAGRADARLVHGYPTLQRPPYARFGHAWVETVEATLSVGDSVFEVIVCHDPSNGAVLPRELYYAIGCIDPALCSRFDHAAASARAVETGEWGAWNESPPDALFASRPQGRRTRPQGRARRTSQPTSQRPPR